MYVRWSGRHEALMLRASTADPIHMRTDGEMCGLVHLLQAFVSWNVSTLISLLPLEQIQACFSDSFHPSSVTQSNAQSQPDMSNMTGTLHTAMVVRPNRIA